ncbi:hypothetical protein C7N83_01375 [Neisseria iguanae]|uniref:Mutator family transposase n=1 Tax=Neisseria iguanae TaxID=90242 RepID=A0A2P7U312_9NEIS|nr:hypothetical protein C7N83_01375 [Neisseria iguanae]
MTKPSFDFETALRQLQSGQVLTGKDGPLTPPIKQPAEAALEAEAGQYLEQKQLQPGRRNGHSKKTVKTGSGSFGLETPRDRNGSFEPQTVKKNQTRLTRHE